MGNNLQDSFLHWYEPVHERFIRYCGSRAFALMGTEDLAQEAILLTLQAFDRIQDKEKLLGYLIGVVNNLVRQAKRRQKFSGEWEEKTLASLADRTDDPTTALDIQLLLKAMERLPEQQREALLLFEVSGFSVREIAEIQQSNEGAVKTRLSRGRQSLREWLQDDPRPTTVSQRLAAYAALFL